MNEIIGKIQSNGFVWTIRACIRFAIRKITLIKTCTAKIYSPPSQEDLIAIENNLKSMGVSSTDYYASTKKFTAFKNEYPFPKDYHGGLNSGVWDEKILEHFIAFDLLNLSAQESYPYIDIASNESPWAAILQNKGFCSYSIDLEKSDKFGHLDYYLEGDATKTNFENESISSASLQCAYEMFCQR